MFQLSSNYQEVADSLASHISLTPEQKESLTSELKNDPGRLGYTADPGENLRLLYSHRKRSVVRTGRTFDMYIEPRAWELFGSGVILLESEIEEAMNA